ncbi:MAG TPA: PAP2 family protein [Curvibacter sp.]|nr:PAP2 family protein [Curvibacter sp.]
MRSLRRVPGDLVWTLITLLPVLAWDASGLDLPVARLLANARGFPWRDNWLTYDLLHEGGRLLAALGVLALLLYALLPRRPQAGAVHAPRWRAFGAVLLNLGAVPALKRNSLTSCPWDLAEFGGSARYVPHWDWGVLDLGPGHCFPSGHAVAGFAFIALYFVWRSHRPAWARRALWLALAVGLTLGLSQVLRGAHYVSHVAWSAWLCWTLSAAASALSRALAQRRRNDTPTSTSKSTLMPDIHTR